MFQNFRSPAIWDSKFKKPRGLKQDQVGSDFFHVSKSRRKSKVHPIPPKETCLASKSSHMRSRTPPSPTRRSAATFRATTLLTMSPLAREKPPPQGLDRLKRCCRARGFPTLGSLQTKGGGRSVNLTQPSRNPVLPDLSQPNGSARWRRPCGSTSQEDPPRNHPGVCSCCPHTTFWALSGAAFQIHAFSPGRLRFIFYRRS